MIIFAVFWPLFKSKAVGGIAFFTAAAFSSGVASVSNLKVGIVVSIAERSLEFAFTNGVFSVGSDGGAVADMMFRVVPPS